MEAIRLKTKEIPSIINHKNLKNSRISREDFLGGRNYHKNKSGILRERERENFAIQCINQNQARKLLL